MNLYLCVEHINIMNLLFLLGNHLCGIQVYMNLSCTALLTYQVTLQLCLRGKVLPPMGGAMVSAYLIEWSLRKSVQSIYMFSAPPQSTNSNLWIFLAVVLFGWLLYLLVYVCSNGDSWKVYRIHHFSSRSSSAPVVFLSMIIFFFLMLGLLICDCFCM